MWWAEELLCSSWGTCWDMGRKGPESHCFSLPMLWRPSALCFSWERLCWGWHPALSCPGTQVTFCLSPRTTVVIVPGKQDPGIMQGVLVGPSPAQPLAHQAAVAASCSCHRRAGALKSCSPEKSCPPPTLPRCRQEVSPPSCGIDDVESPEVSVGVALWEALAKHFSPTGLPGVVGQDMGCTWGLLVSSRLLPVTMPVGSSWTGCSGVSQRAPL